MSIIKTKSRGINLADNFVFTGTVSGAGGKAPTQQIFSTAGTYTWTKPADCSKVKVTVVGGGGGGGAAGNTAQSGRSGGGAGGGTAIKLIDVSSIASETVTVGAGGTAGVTAGGGGAGGTSSFGSHCSATGGAGGRGANGTTVDGYAIFGGIGSNGDINIRGGNPEHVTSLQGDFPGQGGFSSLGHGSSPRLYNLTNGTVQSARNGCVAGGGGGGVGDNDGISGGHPGAAGIVMVEEFYG
tara:strand:- start:1160 stop:1879 length:720 start_codon:yes stop_codon:yes gene_type:complete